MATYTNVRATGLILKSAVESLYTTVVSLYGEVSGWTLNADDLALPPEGDVKAMVTAYQAVSPSPLRLTEALSDVKASTESASPGTYAIPSTASAVTFTVSGPVPLNRPLGYQAVSASVKILRVAVFATQVDAGEDFTLDIQVNESSLLTVPVSIAAGSAKTAVTLNPTDLTLDTLNPSDVIGYVALSGAADDVFITLWIVPDES